MLPFQLHGLLSNMAQTMHPCQKPTICSTQNVAAYTQASGHPSIKPYCAYPLTYQFWFWRLSTLHLMMSSLGCPQADIFSARLLSSASAQSWKGPTHGYEAKTGAPYQDSIGYILNSISFAYILTTMDTFNTSNSSGCSTRTTICRTNMIYLCAVFIAQCNIVMSWNNRIDLASVFIMCWLRMGTR